MEAVGHSEIRNRTFSGIDVVWLATGTLLLLGFSLRARGYLLGTIPFWEDEAAWAMRLVELPLSEHAIRPLGFMALSKLLARLFSPSETVLRALPWLAGVATLALSPFLAKRLFSSVAARLLFVAVIALHPGAIDLAKEFKPYSLSLALHMALLLLGLRYTSAGRPRDLGALLGLLFVGTFISQDAVFVYPGMFGLLLFDAWRARRLQRLALVALAALSTLGLVAAMYVCLWSNAVQRGDDTSEYWGKKYDVFYVPTEASSSSRPAWTAARLGDIATLPGMRRESWTGRNLPKAALEELKQLDGNVWQALGLLGVGALCLRGRRREGLLLVGPLLTMVVVNALGFWPLGAFRTNLFALLYAAGIAAAAVDRRGSGTDGWDLMPAGVLVVIPFLLLGMSSHAEKCSSMSCDSAFPEALRSLSSLQQSEVGATKSQLVLDNPSCATFRYYLRYHPQKAQYAELNRRFHAQCTKGTPELIQALRRGVKAPQLRAYALLTRARSMADVEMNLPSDLVIEGHTYVGKHAHLIVSVKKKP